MSIVHKIVFIGIVILAAFLRLYNLSQVPPGVNRDEASIGYTAYSLLHTGKDEYGRRYPLSFESFGDWKLPLYIYTTIPFVKIFGLTELAVRLPSALAGIATVAALYYLVLILFSSPAVALVSALILTFMPWHMHISRVESEAIVSVLFSVLGAWILLSGIRKKDLLRLLTAAVLLGLTYYTYHGTHVTTTLLLVGFALIYGKHITAIKGWWVPVVVGMVMIAGIVSATARADHTKISGISIFGDPTVVNYQIEVPRSNHSGIQSPIARLMHNRATYAMVTVFQNYLKSYGTDFLFIKGGGNRAHNILGAGNLLFADAPFLLLGSAWLVYMVKKKEARLILWWLLTSGIAAAITKDAPHSNRMLAVVPALTITIAVGIRYLFSLLPKKMVTMVLVGIVIGYIGSVSYYLDRYFVHFPRNESQHWGYAYKALAPLLFSREYAGKRVVMTHPQRSPYIYLLFYGSYPPGEYQTEARRYPITTDGFTDVAGFNRFSFRTIDWNADMRTPATLIVSPAGDVPDAFAPRIIHTITLADGTPYVSIVESIGPQ